MDNKNRWNLSDELRKKYTPVIKKYLDMLNNLTEDKISQITVDDLEIQLSDTGLAPYTLMTLLIEEFGMKKISFDDNGWELDLWIDLYYPDAKNTFCKKMTICGCGQTFELSLEPTEIDDDGEDDEDEDGNDIDAIIEIANKIIGDEDKED